MEEDIGVKAPLTRLRRRLSLEQSDDVKSPSTPSTPTRRRGGRLAAKPQLDLIEENAAAVSTPKTTLETNVQVIIEQIDEKVSTPTRRSTRTKSIGELPEDTLSTPAKRNTRIKSNTSIVSDSIVTDSPRARRAARRSSQVGSDNETNTITPARKTRRTLKNSSSITDYPVTVENGDEHQTVFIILEEDKSNSSKSTSNNTDNNSSPTISPRKSPRLQEKVSRKSNSEPEDEKENNVQNRVNEENTKLTLNTNKSSSTQQIADKDNASQEINKSAESNSESTSTKEQSSKISKEHFDKNLASLTKIERYITNRSRHNSWNIVSSTAANDNRYYSDNEEIKKKIKNKDKSFDLSKLSSYAVSKKANKSLTESKTDEGALNISMKKSNKNNESFKDVKSENAEQPTNAELKATDKNTEVAQTLHKASDVNTTSELLKFSPEVAQSTILIEDSDSNTGSTNRLVMNLRENEDQCVPVIEHRLANQTIIASLPSTEKIVVDKQNDTLLSFSSSLNRSKDNLDTTRNADQNVLNNDSCEPMDIDMTIPDNISLIDAVNNLSSSIANVSNNDKGANSINKKSFTMQTLEILEKSGNENKNTLILSQIKDISCNDDNVSKTLKTNEDTGNKSCDLNPNKKDDEETIKNNLSVNKITGTPLNHKHLLKHTMQTSTPVITSPKLNQIQIEENNKLNKELSHVETSDDTKVTNEESSQERNNFIFDQAEDAGDDYESGDSQDEEERQYINENDIKDKGETLSTEDDMSNDSDYERDSFIVSSNEEDYELLSGSGDNLTMSDNELTMTTKTKNKYNKRQEKKQKEASREMFESRHKNTSKNFESSKVKKSKTHKRQQIESSSSESEQEIVTKAGKKNRMRLDSSHDTSKVSNGSMGKTNKKTKKLSESINKSEINENEITNIFDESIMNKVDPLSYSDIKLEPKTPQRDLDFSTINFTVRDEVEQVEIDENMTIIDKNESLDPLLATIANDSNDDSSISENEQIKQNFDEVLSELNKQNKMTKIKEHDISLNLNKISKKMSGDPILDQLNVTLTEKKSKKKLPKTSKTFDELNKLSEKKIDTVVPVAADNEDSSESIDIKLLFPEDSNDTDSAECKHKTSDDLIPLKKAEGNTDIKLNMDISEDEVWRGWKADDDGSDAPLEIPYLKHKNTNKMYETSIEQNQNKELPETEEIGALNVSMNASVSAKKKQKKRISSNKDNFGEDVTKKTKKDSSLVETPKSTNKKEDVLISGANADIQPNTSNDKKPKSDKKKKRLSESNCEEKDVKIGKSLIKTSGSEKKKKELSESIGDEHDKIKKSFDKSLTEPPGSERKKSKLSESIGDKHDDEINKSLTKTPGSERKKSKLSESTGDKLDDKIEKSVDKSLTKTPGSERKKSKLSESTGDKLDDKIEKSVDNSLTKTPRSERKRSKLSESTGDKLDDKIEKSVDKSLTKTPGSERKKSKLSESTGDKLDDKIEKSVDKSLTKTPGSERKKSKLSESTGDKLDDKIEKSVDKSLTKTPGSERKKSKLFESTGDKLDDKIEKSVDKSLTKIPRSERKKKKLTESIVDKHDQNNTIQGAVSKKQKRKLSASINEEILQEQLNESLMTVGIATKKRKKTKIVDTESLDFEGSQDGVPNVEADDSHMENEVLLSKKGKIHRTVDDEQIQSSATQTVERSDQNNTIQGAVSKKQKKKLSASINEEILQEQLNESLTTVVIETKKRKKTKIVNTQSLDFKASQDGVPNVKADDSHMENEVLLSKKGKIHRTVDDEQIQSSATQTVERSDQNNTIQGAVSKKQKKKLSASINEEILQEQLNESLTTVVIETKKRKKTKIVNTQSLDFKASQDGVPNVKADDSHMENEVLLSKKGKIHRTVDDEQIQSSATQTVERSDQNNTIQGAVSKKQKKKLSASINEEILQEQLNESLTTVAIETKKRKKTKIFDTQSLDFKGSQDSGVPDVKAEQISAQNIKKDDKKRKQLNTESEKQERKNKAKRKRREDDDEGKQSKILKEHYFDKIHVPRLPAHILNDLDDKPNIEIKNKLPTVSTSQFTIEEIRKQKNKPSTYLEDSVILNDLDTLKKHKPQLKKPKVLPSVLTAAVSDCGSTTNFKVNVLPKDTKFVAQSTGVANYKNDYLYSGRIRRARTFEQYKRQRNFNLSKF